MLNINGLKLPMIGDQIVTGDVRFVDENADSSVDDPGQGLNPGRTFNTLDYAVGKMTASKGDYLLVQPAHTENIASASAVDVDVAGLSIIGIGNAGLRPKYTFTATTSTLEIGAANVRVSNLELYGNINDLAVMVDVNYGGFQMDNCKLHSCNAKECINFINIATTMDDFIFRDLEVYQPSDPVATDGGANTGAIYCVDTENILIEHCRFFGYFETAIVHNLTTKVQRLNINHTELTNMLNWPLELVANSTGSAFQCYGETVTGTDVTDAKLFGIMGTRFWLNDCHMGNDSAAGGQMGAPGTIVTT